MTVTATDTDGSVTTTVAIEVTNVIELTAITGPATVSFAENGGGRVATYAASSEEDSGGITWSLSGTDASGFSVNAPGGALRFHIDAVAPKIFAEPPDFEDPADADADNVYSITLLARVGTATTSSLSVTVTVTDVDEPGAVTLASLKPRLGTELTATLTDADGVTGGTTSWQWERNSGREGWTEIAGATSGSYTPTAADGDRYLRVTATYTDGFGADKTVEAMAPHVVIAHRLSALTVSGLSGVPRDDRAFYPAFDPDTLHYAARCTESVTLILTTEENDTRLSVNGVQRPKGEAFNVGGLGRESDIRITLAGATGASTTYTVHCIDRAEFPKLTTVKADGATEDLMMFKAKWRPPGEWYRGSLIMMDNNGVPRLRKHINDNVLEYFRVYPDDTHPRARYAFTKQGSSYGADGVEMVVLDRYFNTVDDDIHVLSPFNNTDGHDQFILPNGDYVLMAYSYNQRDLSFAQTAFPDLTDSEGGPLGTNEAVQDAAIQVRNADGTVKFNWSSWDHMAIEDCIRGNEFDRQYAHINSLGLIDGDIIAGFRKCSKILRIDLDTGNVVWRTGPSMLNREQWEAGKTLQSNRGPAPLDFVNDPRGGFSGQHGGHITADGNLLVYDNATHCQLPPGIPDDAKGLTQCHTRTRAVEYVFDLPNKELVFQSEFQMPETDPPRTVGGFAGHAEPLDNGEWMISWSNPIRSIPPAPMPNTAMHVDAQTGARKLSFTLENMNDTWGQPNTRVVMVSPVALATEPTPLQATLPPSGRTSVFHSGTADSPQVVVAFSRPVVDFDNTSPSLSVTGATVASVSAHVVAGSPANAYLVTLTPDGAGAITFRLVTAQTCASGGICTADGTMLSEAPAALVIGPPVTVSFEQATYSVTEGASRSVAVRLSSAHQGGRGITIPVVLATTANASADDLTVDESVTFEAGETRKLLAVNALGDDLVEGAETATLGFGTLPHGVTAGSTPTATLTLSDADQAQIAFTTGATQVSEGGQTQLRFAITNGVTFEVDQAINLTLSGTATAGDDFTLADAGNQVLSAPYAITFPAGASSVEATIRAVDDADIEHVAETITVSAQLGLTGASLGTRTIAIPASDVPGTPVVAIAPGSTVVEGTDATFTLSRTASTSLPVSDPLTVSVEVTATGSTLGGAAPATVRFEGGDATADLAVPTLDDSVVEQPGSVTALVRGSTSNPPLYLTRAANSATLNVNDNDVAAFTLSADAADVVEGGTVRLTVTADGVTFAEPQAIALTLGGTATAVDDFTLSDGNGELSDPYAVTLPAHASSVAVTVTALRDGEADAAETIEVSASHDGSSIGTVTITITEPPPPPVVVPVAIGGGGGGGGGPTPSDEDFEWNVERDIEELDSEHGTPSGSWSDGATLWLLENGSAAADAVYAYDLTTGERAEGREFQLDERNRAPRGVWSDGMTIWVSDSGQNKLFAHDLATGERLPEHDLALGERNRDARGIWSDGDVMYVADESDDKVYTYNMPDAIDARLASLSLSGIDIGEFSSSQTEYEGVAAAGVTETTVEAEAAQSGAGVVIEPRDSDEVTDGDQVALDGLEEITVTVTSADGKRTKVYLVRFGGASEEPSTAACLRGAVTVGFSLVVYGGGSVEDLEACAESRSVTALYVPHEGEYVPYILGAPDFVNEEFVALYADGLPSLTPLIAKSEGPPSPAPESGDVPEFGSDCLRGAIATGFSLVLYEGGSVDDLDTCAQGRDVSAVYALVDGEYVPYILGAPTFVNEAFVALFPEGLAPATPLIAKSD